MGGRIDFRAFDDRPAATGADAYVDLDIRLGSGNDTFTIHSTHGGNGAFVAVTSLDTATGNDTVRVEQIDGPTSVFTRAGNDTVKVGSHASDPNPGPLRSRVFGARSTLRARPCAPSRTWAARRPPTPTTSS